jgi:hypothetical protein
MTRDQHAANAGWGAAEDHVDVRELVGPFLACVRGTFSAFTATMARLVVSRIDGTNGDSKSP